MKSKLYQYVKSLSINDQLLFINELKDMIINNKHSISYSSSMKSTIDQLNFFKKEALQSLKQNLNSYKYWLNWFFFVIHITFFLNIKQINWLLIFLWIH